jgi:ADP-ribosylglycohydrolase
MSHLPPDHSTRLERAAIALDGLSVGDAFGQQFFRAQLHERHFTARTAPPGPWQYTDDTEMALGLFEVLDRHGHVEQDDLAGTFARRYVRNPYRGYGAAAHDILAEIANGTPWRNVSQAAFSGQGSMGNGSAMRVAPVGGYFADDLERAAREGRASAEVTHAHPEGLAGGAALAAAAAWAWQQRGSVPPEGARGRLIEAVLPHVAAGPTRDGIELGLKLLDEPSLERVARVLGNGSRVTCPDTVPFCLWCADRFLADFPAALWACVTAGGDVDTTGAIVGGVVALASAATIPPAWRAAREPLDFEGGRPRRPGR